ncbi:proline/glycine betaine transporter [Escherichia coli]|uniref:Proline/glycine betaine transporter n=1 Tax=Escherichia coli TaxID=562 RepID=A0A376L4Q2_ECOLX|nr:proline/glycine betaine transporter [Escherichia coli]
MLLTYMPSYLSHNLHYSEDHGVLIIIAIMIGMLFVQPVMGLLSDRFGRRPFVLLGSVALFVLAIPAFILINSNVIGLIFAGLLMLAVILNCFTGVMASTLPAMFPTHIRYSALAAAFNISVLVAGLTPTLAAWLVESSQNLMMPGLLPDGSGGDWFNHRRNHERDGKSSVERCDTGGVRYTGSEGNSRRALR